MLTVCDVSFCDPGAVLHHILLPQPEQQPGGKWRTVTASAVTASFTWGILWLRRTPSTSFYQCLYVSVHILKKPETMTI